MGELVGLEGAKAGPDGAARPGRVVGKSLLASEPAAQALSTAAAATTATTALNMLDNIRTGIGSK